MRRPAGRCVMRHSWKGGDTCLRCGLHREGAGAGHYGAMVYYFDASRETYAKAPACDPEAHRRIDRPLDTRDAGVMPGIPRQAMNEPEPPRVQVIDLFEALKSALEGKGS